MLSFFIALIIGSGHYAARSVLSSWRFSVAHELVRHPVGTRPCQDHGMDEYFIGAGALLTAGPTASITGATLHAQTEPGLAGRVEAAVIDFEATQLGELSRILIVAAGWSGARFQSRGRRPAPGASASARSPT